MSLKSVHKTRMVGRFPRALAGALAGPAQARAEGEIAETSRSGHAPSLWN
jgi:hypothetical protein